MGFFGNGKYKKRARWDFFNNDGDDDIVDDPSDPDYGYARKVEADYDYGYTPAKPSTSYWGGGYGYYYKPSYDMSVSLESRVTQLIKTITGKNLHLVKSVGWGSNDEYFFYNPEDLKNATDDEVFGRILHQLSKEMYVDKETLKKLNEAEAQKPYKQLLDSLENNRADHQLQNRYAGVQYYAKELWGVRRFDDNPRNKYPDTSILENFKGEEHKFASYFFYRHKVQDLRQIKDNVRYAMRHKPEFDERIAHDIKIKEYAPDEPSDNPAWEFCFNIAALQNGETDFDFTQEKILHDFQKAKPLIEKYLAEPDFQTAFDTYYEDIKKYYPKPTEKQQEQMERQMGDGAGMSQEQMEIQAEKARMAMEAKSEGGTQKQFMQEFEVRNEFGKYDEERDLAKYKEYYAEFQGLAMTLFALIRSILKDNVTKRYDRPFKRGKIDARRMYKYLTTGNLRIFKKPRIVSHKQYPMMIVVDMSGSMRGERSHFATKGAIVLIEVLEKLGFPYEVIAYNGGVYNVKKFNEAINRSVIPTLEQAQGDNNEPEVMELVKKHFAAFDSTQKKSVFWITDGEAYNSYFVKTEVTKFEKEMNATVYAIGIGDVRKEALQGAYNTVVKVDSLNQLPKELVDIMRSQFRRT